MKISQWSSQNGDKNQVIIGFGTFIRTFQGFFLDTPGWNAYNTLLAPEAFTGVNCVCLSTNFPALGRLTREEWLSEDWRNYEVYNCRSGR